MAEPSVIERLMWKVERFYVRRLRRDTGCTCSTVKMEREVGIRLKSHALDCALYKP